mmetsp:Transcript_28756/g.40502  ORF Transcript_28756/g.40502 Transcript_28756/m.40502 type:complete len:266 (+) Transcript_28756:198-995(+)
MASTENRTQRLLGKVIIVTGAASGIGRATSIELAKEGAKVVLADLNQDGANETMKLLSQIKGSEFAFVKTNVTNETDVSNMVQFAVEKFGRIDGAFNNAGILQIPSKLHEVSSEDYDQIIAVNVKGVWLCLKYEIMQILKQQQTDKEQRQYAIVNTASIAGLVAHRLGAVYSASKHAVNGLTKSAAIDYARNNIRINSVCPAFTVTPMLRAGVPPEFDEKLRARIPLYRLGRDDEVAKLTCWLLSDYSTFNTGDCVPIAGGLAAL